MTAAPTEESTRTGSGKLLPGVRWTDWGLVAGCASALCVDDRTGPLTAAGPGQVCLICDDQIEVGGVFWLVRDGEGRHGVGHESCLEER